MTKAKEPKNPGCASTLWKGFSDAEKVLWTILYKSFLISAYYPDELEFNKKKNKKLLEAVAHNLACEAVWRHRNFCEINFGYDRQRSNKIKRTWVN